MSEATTQPAVLCIEDDEAAANLIRRGLQRAGYEVSLAGSGSEGLKLFEQATWAAVLVDNQLPDQTGLQVLEQMQRLRTLPATVMVTGRGNEHLAVAALKLGAHDYLVKDSAESYLELLPEVVAKAMNLVREREQAQAVAVERERLLGELAEALARIKTLSGLIPICASCKSIRNDKGFWESLESYLSAHSDAMLSHGLCPPCVERYFPPGQNG
jgi:DNA-binding response OmpR family regulator